MNKLIIDTTDNKRTIIKLESHEKLEEISEERVSRSQSTLVLIDKILKNNKLTSKDIDEVEVNEGPGSFTGTRVGVAIANALGFSLGVKVNGLKGRDILPKYK